MSFGSRTSQDDGDNDRIVVETPGPDEWIVGTRTGERAVQVYRVADGDWLVSEVGRGSEGRGTDLATALRALRAGARAPQWWDSIPRVIGEDHDSTR
jgi:hypothetical protein